MMPDIKREAENAGESRDEAAAHDSRDLDPRDTDHPTGAAQAADNAASESPS